jgi:hypothetical protein
MHATHHPVGSANPPPTRYRQTSDALEFIYGLLALSEEFYLVDVTDIFNAYFEQLHASSIALAMTNLVFFAIEGYE